MKSKAGFWFKKDYLIKIRFCLIKSQFKNTKDILTSEFVTI